MSFESLIEQVHLEVDEIRKRKGLPPFDWEKERNTTNRRGNQRYWLDWLGRRQTKLWRQQRSKSSAAAD